ncbi:MAG: hypothetical protein BEN18_07665 [Epulopiscium sp. Nuni2H_MBin001]|nr:MAG: hypothetical protein BEN18_07665 [Epulopiscium sp. Nuni2H_MBin001]
MDILVGQQGSGKTIMCYRKIRKTLNENPYQKVIMLVPEQFSLETQKELATLLAPGLFLVDVISFSTLVNRAIGDDVTILDDLEKVMILKRVIIKHKAKLGYYSDDTDGFLEQLNILLNTCEKFGIDTLRSDTNSILKSKLDDIQNIFKWFYEFIESKFYTGQGSLEVLRDTLQYTKYYEDTVILVDGFYSFTKNQLEVLMELYKQSKQMLITLPMDRLYCDDEPIRASSIFYQSILTLRNIRKNVDDAEVYLCNKYGEFKHRDFEYLTENYFKTAKINCAKVSDVVSLYCYRNISLEVEEVAKQIKSLVRDNGYRYNDISVLTGDVEAYKIYIDTTFTEYGIPHFLDINRSIYTNALVSMIISLLDVITTSWSYKSMMALLKSDMLPIKRADVDYLENYILAQGINRKNKWQDSWQYGDSSWDFERLNNLRLEISSMLSELETNFNANKNKNGRLNILDATTVLYRFLEQLNVYDKVQDIVEYHRRHNNLSLELENSQIWEQVMMVLERLVDILGAEEVSIKSYKSLLSTSLNYEKMKIIPASQDQVLIGDIQRTRLPRQKAVFILGVNEGVIPATDNNKGLFSDMDMATLQETADDKIYEAFVHNNLYYGDLEIYTALNKPSERLFVSTVTSDEKGAIKRPSIVFNRLKRLFTIKDTPNRDFVDNIFSSNATLGEVGSCFRQFAMAANPSMDFNWRDALSWYIDNPLYSEHVTSSFRRLFDSNIQPQLDTAINLYSDNIVTNVSQLEKYRKCPCSYFIQYGLKASERQLFKWNSADIGTIFHSVLERYPIKLRENNTDWLNVDAQKKQEIVRDVVEESLNKHNVRNIQGAQINHIVDKIEKISTRAIDAITYQLKQGKFEPKAYEYKFGEYGMPQIEVQLPDGQSLALRGTIDRVDVYVADNNEYVKILDYKSGKQAFDLVEVYYGLQLQLLLYLDAYLKLNSNNNAKTLTEAGVYYFKIDVADVKYAHGKSLDELQQELYRSYKLSGLTLDDVDVAKAIEVELDANVIPVKQKKAGGFDSNSVVATTQQFQSLRNHIYNLVSKLGQDIVDGKINARPYKLNKATACDYCNYHGICQFDEKLAGNDYDVLDCTNRKEILNQVVEEEQNGLD